MNIFEKKNSILGMEEEFNRWSISIGKHQVDKGQSVVYVRIKKLGPVRSRIKELEIGVT